MKEEKSNSFEMAKKQIDITTKKLIISVGITGSRITRQQTSYIPITPEEIARSGIEAWRAGASILHIHVRDPKTGTWDSRSCYF